MLFVLWLEKYGRRSLQCQTNDLLCMDINSINNVVLLNRKPELFEKYGYVDLMHHDKLPTTSFLKYMIKYV